jgi:IS1 family transposase
MNKLTNTRRAAIVRSLVEGASIRSIARIHGCDKDTVLRLLVEVGEFCSIYQDITLTNLNTKRVEADEIWSFVGAKEANKTKEGQGDIWTFTALDADSKLMISWLVGPRSTESTRLFMDDVASRLANRVQLSTDGWVSYPSAVERSFGWNGVDYATVVKQYGNNSDMKGGRYSPSPVVTGVEKVEVMGTPKRSLISTSYVERSNLTMRMSMRRFTRLTNGFSKKAENHAHAVSLHFFFYNFCRAHTTLTKAAKGIKTTPAMAAGLTNHVWTVEHMLDLMDPTRLIA